MQNAIVPRLQAAILGEVAPAQAIARIQSAARRAALR
jgi:hypothetical protein